MIKYIIDPKDIPVGYSTALSKKMEELAAEYIKDNNLDLEIDDLWNDGLCEDVQERVELARNINKLFYAGEYFQELIDSMAPKKTSEAQRAASYRYDKNNTKRISLKLNLSTDSDILAKLESEKNVQGYIKKLIRSDILK